MEKYGGKKKKGWVSTATFQKKVVVFKYMGPDARMRGLLPQIPVQASESEVRDEICDVLRTCSPDLSECIPSDFEFIEMSGKQARVPQCKAGFEWEGRTVKELAGSGCVYVRLTKDIAYDKSSSSDELLPVFVDREDPPSASGSSSNSIDGNDPPSTTPTSNTISAKHPPSCSDTSAANEATAPCTSRSVVSPIFIDDDDDFPALCKNGASDPAEDITKMIEMFPNMTEEQLRYLYDLSKHSFTCAVDCALAGPSLETLRSLARMHLTVPLEESPRIRLDVDDNDLDWVEAALAFYKQAKFNKQAYVRVSIRGQPGIDTGGVRRQFFSVVFTKLAQPSASFSFFDGLPNRLRPAFKASTIASGMLTTIGTMVAHSILMDGQGFPFLADYCFYYIYCWLL